jgi:PAS domain S-box-containing protein
MITKTDGPQKIRIRLAVFALAAATALVVGSSAYGQKSTRSTEAKGSSMVALEADTQSPPAGAGRLPLTEEERAWLRSHSRIRVSQDPAWAPIEFADAGENPSGIAESYLQLVEQRLGITFERVPGLSWQEGMARLQRRDIDMTICLSKTPERIQFLSFTKPYLKIPIVILAREAVTYIGDMRELSEHKVAVVDGYALAEWISRDFPDIHLVKVKTVEDGLHRLQRGEVSCFVDNLLVISHYLAKLRANDLKIAGISPYEYAQSMAVRKDWPMLALILQKAIDSISPEERTAIYRQWVPNLYEPSFDYRLFWRLLAIFSVSLVGLIFWIRKLTGEIKQRKLAEENLAGANRLLQTIVNTAPMRIFWKDRESRYLGCNLAFTRDAGLSNPEELIGKDDYQLPWKEQAGKFRADDGQVIDTGLAKLAYEEQLASSDGELLWIRTSKVPLRNEQQEIIGMLGIYEDITERKQLKGQLIQAQKMEAIGQLAGGVAHDFNNKLAVILGYADLALMQTSEDQPLFHPLQQIHKAAESSAGLTRQLLAFARRQPVVPKVLDLNINIHGLLQMLHRLIGVNIELVWRPGADLWPVRMDPTQMDQVLANLSVNARDAMGGGGRLTIETANITIAGADCAAHPGCTPGDYVSLTVSDNGCGMDEALQAKIFEPFFTTKEVGKGTGLGLSTVFGIVKQNEGLIKVYSQPGQGTSFKIYLPRHAGTEAPLQSQPSAAYPQKGNECILLVDDDPSIRGTVAMMLETLGYRVVEARSPAEAIDLAEQHANEIRLLITDVIMPEINGRDLAMRLAPDHPNLKCLFMSGYTATVIAPHGVLEKGRQFIQKPFTLDELSSKVREALGIL